MFLASLPPSLPPVRDGLYACEARAAAAGGELSVRLVVSPKNELRSQSVVWTPGGQASDVQVTAVRETRGGAPSYSTIVKFTIAGEHLDRLKAARPRATLAFEGGSARSQAIGPLARAAKSGDTLSATFAGGPIPARGKVRAELLDGKGKTVRSAELDGARLQPPAGAAGTPFAAVPASAWSCDRARFK